MSGGERWPDRWLPAVRAARQGQLIGVKPPADRDAEHSLIAAGLLRRL